LARLRHGEAELMLNTAYDDGERPLTPDTTRVASHADTGLFMGCEDREGAYAHLLSQGVKARQ
jgi:glyoxylase I family protein